MRRNMWIFGTVLILIAGIATMTDALGGESGGFSVRWLDIENSRWGESSAVQGGDTVALTAPGAGHWVALLIR